MGTIHSLFSLSRSLARSCVRFVLLTSYFVRWKRNFWNGRLHSCKITESTLCPARIDESKILLLYKGKETREKEKDPPPFSLFIKNDSFFLSFCFHNFSFESCSKKKHLSVSNFVFKFVFCTYSHSCIETKREVPRTKVVCIPRLTENTFGFNLDNFPQITVFIYLAFTEREKRINVGFIKVESFLAQINL